jgi:hypothetical protein
MNEIEIKKLNDNITYDEGQIYWEHCKGYTSKLVQRLLKSGYKIIKSGSVYILKDKDNIEVVNGYSWETLLYNIAIHMR